VYVLTAAVVALAVLVLLNMLLTTAMIRRMGRKERGKVDVGGLPVGTVVPEFEATTVDGDEVTLAGRRSLVAFYSTSCPGCEAQAPDFAAAAGELAEQGLQVVPVLMENGSPREGSAVRELLGLTGRLVVENGTGGLAAVFATRATPSYFAVGPDRRITGKGLTLGECLAGSPS
jgi:thiol-disulfide isomerase/thioredoxin